MSGYKLLFLCCCGWVCCAQAQIRSVHSVGPRRNFGYLVGDVIAIDTIIEAAAGTSLDMRSLPVAGPLDAATELRSIAVDMRGGEIRLHAEYQTFFAPDSVTDTELPGFDVQVIRGALRQTAHIPAWPFQVSPLRAARRLLADPSSLKPDHGILPASETLPRGRAIASLCIALLALLAFAGQLGWLPALRRARHPFETAAYRVRRLRNTSAAYQEMHRAFDATAGRHVFADDIDAFIGAHPRFAACRADIEAFYRSSRQFFFGRGIAPDDFDLLRFAKAMRRQERRR